VINENTLATCSHDSTVRLFDVRTPYRNQTTQTIPLLTSDEYAYDGASRLNDDIRRYGIRPQNVGGGLYHRVADSDIDNGSLLIDLGIHSELFQMDVHPIDRKRFITSGNDGTVRLFDMRAIKLGERTDQGFSVNLRYGETREVTGAAFDDSGDRIATTVIGGLIYILDANQFTDLATLQPPEGVMPPAQVTGELSELRGHHSEMTLKTVNWFGNFVVTGTDEGDVFFYDPIDGTIVNVLSGHDQPVNIVAVHREKRLLATSGVDDDAILWEPQTVSAVSLRRRFRAAQEAQEANNGLPRTRGCIVM
jgi:WD40 repeat protein